MRWVNVTRKFQLLPAKRHRCKNITTQFFRDFRLFNRRIATFWARRDFFDIAPYKYS